MSASVLPARAGMSPFEYGAGVTAVSAPRTGGDEPHVEVECLAEELCSPHGRG